MNILKLYSSNNYMVINRDFAKENGLNNAIIFGNLCSMASCTENNFFFTIEKLSEETLLCPDTIKKGLKYLSEKGYITKERKGLPAKNWFCINEDKLLLDLTSNKLVEKPTNKKAVNNTDYISNNKKANNTLNKENTPQAKELASFLFSKCRELDTKFRIGKDKETINSWVIDIEKLIRIDKRDLQEIHDVIAWCKTGGCFWSANIQSGKKLREKFPTLVLQMKEKPRAKNGLREGHKLDMSQIKVYRGEAE